MPKIPIDYSKSLIYMIKHKDDVNNENIYVGSTTNFIQRKYNHGKACYNPKNKEYNLKKNIYIRENGGWNDFIMLEIEKFPCNDHNELRKREDEIMAEYTNILNGIRASRSREEYRQDNKEHIKKYYEIYNENNKEHIKEERKKYRENNKEEIKKYREIYNENNKEHIKEVKKKYREDNKEDNKEYAKKYYENNKETIKEKIGKKITCECGCVIRYDSMSKHKKSRKHLNYLELSS